MIEIGQQKTKYRAGPRPTRYKSTTKSEQKQRQFQRGSPQNGAAKLQRGVPRAHQAANAGTDRLFGYTSPLKNRGCSGILVIWREFCSLCRWLSHLRRFAGAGTSRKPLLFCFHKHIIVYMQSYINLFLSTLWTFLHGDYYAAYNRYDSCIQ